MIATVVGNGGQRVPEPEHVAIDDGDAEIGLGREAVVDAGLAVDQAADLLLEFPFFSNSSAR
jgi:hypothetical protein